MTDLELYEEMVRLTRLGETFVLATVVDSSGSAPRKAGAKMLVRNDGSLMGSVGGGRVEKETVAASRVALAEGTPGNLLFTLTEEHGFACGGSMAVYIEPQGMRPLLVLFGAGHIGRAVAPLARGCGFRVTVIDDRAEQVTGAGVPGADRVICAGVAEAFRGLVLDDDSFVVIATPGHLADFDAVRLCLGSDAGFIGLLGSRRKRETLMQRLTEEGFDAGQRGRIVTPVGLDIGARTPEEIAVSIVGQLIALRKRP